jgi:two-component system, NarL family, nitrate/nitrite response regulator NarL
MPMVSPVTEESAARLPIRVFIAEDHAITLWGLRRLIDSAPARMRVVGTASNCAELTAHDALPSADVIVLDLDLGGEDATSTLAALRQRSAGHVLVLTGSDDAGEQQQAVIKGARGVVHKSEPADIILRAIEKVHDGEIWLHRSMLGVVLGRLTRDGAADPQPVATDPNAQRIASLTPREREIVATMISRSDTKQFAVADELHISEHTLRNHLTTIYSKLGVHGRLELHVFATKHGLGAPAASERTR